MENYNEFSTESLQQMLNFVQNNSASTNDIDLLVVIQTFVQQITINLKQHLDPSMI
jgi:hypothetical protein